jgi:hypothetical protein
MLIYLPKDSFDLSAKILLSKDLKLNIKNLSHIYSINAFNLGYGKPLEDFTSLKIGISTPGTVSMWRNYDNFLSLALISMIDVLVERDPLLKSKYSDKRDMFFRIFLRTPSLVPFWWSEQVPKSKLMESSRAELITKNPDHYKNIFPDTNPNSIRYVPEMTYPSSSPKVSRHFW